MRYKATMICEEYACLTTKKKNKCNLSLEITSFIARQPGVVGIKGTLEVGKSSPCRNTIY